MLEPEQVSRFERELRALAQGADDVEGLRQVLDLAAELDRQVTAAARRLHAEGYSWTELGRAAFISRQAARQRWAERPAPVEPELPAETRSAELDAQAADYARVLGSTSATVRTETRTAAGQLRTDAHGAAETPAGVQRVRALHAADAQVAAADQQAAERAAVVAVRRDQVAELLAGLPVHVSRVLGSRDAPTVTVFAHRADVAQAELDNLEARRRLVAAGYLVEGSVSAELAREQGRAARDLFNYVLL